MTSQTAVAIAAALVAMAFAFSTFERWLEGHRRHDLAWSAALSLFVVAATALAVGAGLGWDAATFRVFYLFGAIINVPVLALGTVYLLWGRRVGDRAALGVALACMFAVGVVVTAPLRGPIPRHALVQGSQVLGVLPRVLAVVGSAGGALVIVGGAVWSIFSRRRRIANGLIAAGTLILGASGLLNSVADAMTVFAVALLVGISVVFLGFMVAAAGVRAAEPVAAPASVTVLRSRAG